MKMFPKDKRGWLRALEIAKILFEDQGYHCLFLEGIEKSLRRKFMYSPRIREDLIPRIYQVAKSKRVKMTALVNEILEEALNGGDGLEAKENIKPQTTGDAFNHASRKGGRQ
jgi:hypothetical protein